MSWVRSEPVQVWLINGRPARFVWRERLYTVLSILERPAADEAGNRDDSGEHDDAGGRDGAQVNWRCWKVTASPGRNVPADVYRLCNDPAAGRWSLTRIGR
jgi:hypothetical protein